jgi:hypothetical protein
MSELICGCGGKIEINQRATFGKTECWQGRCDNINCPLNNRLTYNSKAEAEAAFKLATRAEINLPERK